MREHPMNSQLRIAFVALAALSFHSVAIAQSGSRERGWEFGAEATYALSTDVGFDGGTTLDIEDDIGAALIFGYRFDPRLELQFSLDWNDVDYRGVLRSALVPSLTANISGTMETFTPRLNGTYNFLDAPLTPFVSAGLGWSFIDTNIPTGQVQVGCWWDPWWGQICTPYQPTKDVDAFMYELGVGARWDVGESATFRAAYHKRWLDLNNATSTPDFDRFELAFVWRYSY
jgi:opacity protein-like surface antigen